MSNVTSVKILSPHMYGAVILMDKDILRVDVNERGVVIRIGIDFVTEMGICKLQPLAHCLMAHKSIIPNHQFIHNDYADVHKCLAASDRVITNCLSTTWSFALKSSLAGERRSFTAMVDEP